MDHIDKLSYCWSYSKLKVAIKRYMLNNTLLGSPQHLKSLSNYLRWKPLKLFSSIYTCLVKLVLNLIEKTYLAGENYHLCYNSPLGKLKRGKHPQKLVFMSNVLDFIEMTLLVLAKIFYIELKPGSCFVVQNWSWSLFYRSQYSSLNMSSIF